MSGFIVIVTVIVIVIVVALFSYCKNRRHSFFFAEKNFAEHQFKDGHTSQTSCETRITSTPNQFVRRWGGAVVPQSASLFQERLSKSPRTGAHENHAPLPHPRQLRTGPENARHMARLGQLSKE